MLPRGARRSLASRTAAALAAATLAATTILAPATAARAASDEYEVKAAFLLNFAKYVEWPESTFIDDRPFLYCLWQHDPFGPTWSTVVAERTIAGRAVERRFVFDPAAARDCHVLFVPAGTGAIRTIAAALAGAATLLVGEAEDFVDEGGAIRLFLTDRRIRFEVNVAVARERGLEISSQLLRLATRVVRR